MVVNQVVGVNGKIITITIEMKELILTAKPTKIQHRRIPILTLILSHTMAIQTQCINSINLIRINIETINQHQTIVILSYNINSKI